MSLPTIAHKRGDTFSASGVWEDPPGTPLDLTGYTLACRLVHTSGQTQDVIVTVDDAPNGVFSLSLSAAQTSSMPVGTWRGDVERTHDASGTVKSTDTFVVEIVEDYTP